MSKLSQGRVVKVVIADPAGRNSKEHPVILIGRDDDIRNHDPVIGVIASHTAATQTPRKDCCIEIPHSGDGKCNTGFFKPTVAVCDWVVKLTKEQIAAGRLGGMVQARHVFAIHQKIAELKAKRSGPKVQAATPPPQPPATELPTSQAPAPNPPKD